MGRSLYGPFEPLPAGITVKDAFTALLVQVANPPTFPFAGSDGKFHVAYNVVLQNASRVSATIRRLEVVDATDSTKVIASFADNQLVDPTCGFGDCNRLRALPSALVQDTVIPPQEARVLFVDFAFDSPRRRRSMWCITCSLMARCRARRTRPWPGPGTQRRWRPSRRRAARCRRAGKIGQR
jgi:hypothetical protein